MPTPRARAAAWDCRLRRGSGAPTCCGRRRTGYRHPQADRVFIVTLVVGFFAIALLLVMLYPSPLHLLGLI